MSVHEVVVYCAVRGAEVYDESKLQSIFFFQANIQAINEF